MNYFLFKGMNVVKLKEWLKNEWSWINILQIWRIWVSKQTIYTQGNGMLDQRLGLIKLRSFAGSWYQSVMQVMLGLQKKAG